MSLTPFFADGGATVAIVVVVVVAGIGLYFLLRNSHRIVLRPSATSIPLYQSITVAAALEEKSWAFGDYKSIDASFVVRVGAGGYLSPQPMSGTTTAATPATITVTGTAVGTDTLTVAFDLRGSAAGSATVTLNVIG